jgi:hypothetical protein
VDCAPQSIVHTENWLHWIVDLDNPNDNDNNWEADNDFNMQLDNGIKDVKTPKQQHVSAAQKIPELIQPSWRLERMVKQVLTRVTKMEMRPINGKYAKLHKIHQGKFRLFFTLFDQQLHLDQSYWEIVSSRRSILENELQ